MGVAAERGGTHVAVSVSDEGPGIPAERLPRLFRKYAVPGDGDAKPGLREAGLGLAICKGLVEAHDGRIRAESGEPGQGARFTFTIPAAGDPVQAVGAVPGRARPAGPDGGPPPVLVVDDDPRMLRFVRDALAQAGYAPLATGDPGAPFVTGETAAASRRVLDPLFPDPLPQSARHGCRVGELRPLADRLTQGCAGGPGGQRFPFPFPSLPGVGGGNAIGKQRGSNPPGRPTVTETSPIAGGHPPPTIKQIERNPPSAHQLFCKRPARRDLVWMRVIHDKVEYGRVLTSRASQFEVRA